MPADVNGFVLGVDLGVKSVGLALIDAQGQRFVRTAVRVFPAGVEGDFESGKDESKNKKRREARMARRQTERRARRMHKVFHLLQRQGLLPEGEPQDCLKALDRELARTYGPHPGAPYTLRAKALDHPLKPHELGRALYHLAQRRGFKSNRRAPVKEDEEKGKVASGIEGLAKRMADASARTLGEYFAGVNPEKERIRTRYTDRRMYAAEFDAIWAAQAVHHPEILTAEFRERLREAIFRQRPLKDQSHLIGACSLMPEEKRAPLYDLDVQRWRLLDKVNNLKLAEPEERRLTAEERAKLVKELTVEESLTYVQVRKLLGLPKSTRFSIESGGENKILGNVTYARFAKALNLRWAQMARAEQEALVGLWASAGDDDEFRAALDATGKYSVEEIAELLKVRLPDDYTGFSLAAMRRLLPHMEAGMTTGEARKVEFPESFAAVEPKATLPPVVEALPELRNPAVMRTLTELRKAVNELIRKYGKPAEIRVELARDLKRNKKDRQALSKQMRDNEAKREKARAALKEYGLTALKPRDPAIEKYLLWEECGHTCPYSGRSISLDGLFGHAPQYDIEHIVPYARSLDDSFQNKTLCLKEYNAQKRNRTPWEAFGADEETWAQMVGRVKKWGNRGKEKRFLLQETDTAKLLEQFSSNELNDTRYMSKLAKRYLGTLYGGDVDAAGKRRVFACAGGVTALLRRLWNLNTILNEKPEKSRDDHRHHAVDAAVVAMVTNGMIKRLGDAAEQAEAAGQRRVKTFAPPWEGFRDELEEQIQRRTVVSHRPERKLAGPLHEETLYGRPHVRNGKAVVHIRVPVHLLSAKDLYDIVDGEVMKAVKARLLERLGKEDFKRLEHEPPMLKTRKGASVPIRRVRIRVVAKTVPIGKGEPRQKRNVITGDNHHMAVFAVRAKGKTSYVGEVVPRLEAVRRHANGEPVVRKDRGPDSEFLFTLSKGDMVRWREELWRVRGVKSTTVVELSRASDARLKADSNKTGGLEATTINSFCKSGLRKVHVSALGEIREAHD
jgi:CRISPR-associated endonuclease Csn1